MQWTYWAHLVRGLLRAARIVEQRDLHGERVKICNARIIEGEVAVLPDTQPTELRVGGLQPGRVLGTYLLRVGTVPSISKNSFIGTLPVSSLRK